MPRKISCGTYLFDAPTTETCMRYLKEMYPNTMWSRYKVRRFRSCAAFTAEFCEPNCSTYFISYWTPLAQWCASQDELDIIANPYNYTVTTRQHFDKWLADTFGYPLAREIKNCIKSFCKEETPTYKRILSLDLTNGHVHAAGFYDMD